MTIKSLSRKLNFIFSQSANYKTKVRLLFETIKLNFTSRLKMPHSTSLFEITLKGYKTMTLRNTDIVTLFEIFDLKPYDYPFQLSNNPIIVDAGSHIGLSSIWFKNQNINSTIYCLEPNIENFKLLSTNNTDFTLLNKALSNKCETLFLNEANLSVNHSVADSGNPIQSISIMDLIKSHSLPKIDLLKIDIEGHENVVFNDVSSWITYVDNIIIELHDTLSFEQFSQKLVKFGFTCHKVQKPGIDNIAVAIRDIGH